MCDKSFQSCPTLCDLMNCSPPVSSVHGILQARTLEWVATTYSRGSSCPRDPSESISVYTYGMDWIFFYLQMSNCSSSIYWEGYYLFSNEMSELLLQMISTHMPGSALRLIFVFYWSVYLSWHHYHSFCKMWHWKYALKIHSIIPIILVFKVTLAVWIPICLLELALQFERKVD